MLSDASIAHAVMRKKITKKIGLTQYFNGLWLDDSLPRSDLWITILKVTFVNLLWQSPIIYSYHLTQIKALLLAW